MTFDFSAIQDASILTGGRAYYGALDTLTAEFAKTAAERDKAGGTAKRERDLIRESGLLRLSIPDRFGGLGADWIEILMAVRRLATVDSSVAHLFGFHHLLLATIRFFGTDTQVKDYWEKTVRHNWFWGNALNPRDNRTSLSKAESGYVLNGEKSFCSGASDSDMLIVSAIDEAASVLKVAAIPTSREGIVIHDDWDNMGQRQTDSGTVSFHRVFVADHELLLSPGPLGSPFASLRPCLAQLFLTNIYLGIAEGAMKQAKSYLRGLPSVAFDRIGADPYILRNFGELAVEIAGSRALTDMAQTRFQRGWDVGGAMTWESRGEIAIAIAAAKVASSRTSLDLSSRIFELMGARSTTAANRFDRFWRNARTHTLHDPIDHKLREIGNWTLNGHVPDPSFYS